MKRYFVTCIVFVMILFCSCGKNGPNWQEQYDLGLRYLTEGNYQEAIIAFTAAIEIDARRPEAYLKAAEAYEAIGNSEAGREILEKGYEATGDEALKPKEETSQEWISDEFISPQELTIDNIPFYMIDIYTAFEVYWDETMHSEIYTVDGGGLHCSGMPSFGQNSNADVLSNVFYGGTDPDFGHQPEFRGITMGMTTTEVLERLGFTVYGIQEFIYFAENEEDYFENGSLINIKVEKTQIMGSINDRDGDRNMQINIRLYDDETEKRIEMMLVFEDNILGFITLHNG